MDLLQSDVYHRVNRIRTSRESGNKRKGAPGVPGSKKPKKKKQKTQVTTQQHTAYIQCVNTHHYRPQKQVKDEVQKAQAVGREKRMHEYFEEVIKVMETKEGYSTVLPTFVSVLPVFFYIWFTLNL